MDSLTKNRQDFATLQTLATRAYGSALSPTSPAQVIELGSGWFNIAYKITLNNGAEKVLKVAPSIEVMSHERNAMQTEWAAIDFISQHTNVPVATIEFKDDSLELIDVPYFFMPFYKGIDVGEHGATLTAQDHAYYWEQVGALNFTLNQVVGPGFGPLLNPEHATWVSAYRAFFEGTLADGERRGVSLGEYTYQEMRAILRNCEPYLADVREPRYIEQDMWTKAVIFDGRTPLAHIDHERAYFGDPILEAGFAAIDFPLFGDARAFMRGYGKTTLTASETQRRALYSLHLALIMIIEAEYRGFNEPSHLDFVMGTLKTIMSKFGR